jgi:hypothetical protein
MVSGRGGDEASRKHGIDYEGLLMGSAIESSKGLRAHRAAVAPGFGPSAERETRGAECETRSAECGARDASLICPRCGLTITPRVPSLAIRYCPRCVARTHRIVELTRTGLSA